MLHPDDIAFLFSPLEGSFPTFFLSESLTVRFVCTPNEANTVREGFSFLAHLSAESVSLHGKCLSREDSTRFRIRRTPQNSLLLPLTGFDRYTLLYLEYAYAPRETLIRAVLFPGRREYRHALLFGDRGTTPCLEQMRGTDPAADSRFTALLRAEGAVGELAPPFDLHGASLLAAQCLSVPAHSGEQPLFALQELLEIYRTRILSGFCFLDCETVLETEGDAPVFARLEPDRFLLLLTSVLSVLGVLAEDGRIRISVSSLGENAQVYFRLHCPRLAGQLIRCCDLQMLLSGAPKKQFALTLADHIIGLSGYEILLSGDPGTGILTLSLYIPLEKRCREFKSPADSLLLLERSLPAARGMLAYLFLLSDSQKKQ